MSVSQSSILAAGNKCSVRLVDPATLDLVMEIVPPNLKSISFCQLSPSARHLLIGNEVGQYFYVYELFPPKCRRHTCACVTPYRLQAVLFRGWSQTLITDCAMTQ